jgi:hypothetical protein
LLLTCLNPFANAFSEWRSALVKPCVFMLCVKVFPFICSCAYYYDDRYRIIWLLFFLHASLLSFLCYVKQCMVGVPCFLLCHLINHMVKSRPPPIHSATVLTYVIYCGVGWELAFWLFYKMCFVWKYIEIIFIKKINFGIIMSKQ